MDNETGESKWKALVSVLPYFMFPFEHLAQIMYGQGFMINDHAACLLLIDSHRLLALCPFMAPVAAMMYQESEGICGSLTTTLNVVHSVGHCT